MDVRTVDIDERRAGLLRVLDVMQAELGPQVPFADDYYWSVPTAFDVSESRPDLTSVSLLSRADLTGPQIRLQPSRNPGPGLPVAVGVHHLGHHRVGL